METKTFKAGTLLIKEWEQTQSMFIIQKGKARVFKTYLRRRVTLAVLAEGEIFGELSFFDAAPRSASVEALTDLEALVIDGAQAQAEIAAMPSWIMPVLRSTFRRFREADHKIMLLQSMNDYQKRVFKLDTVGKTIYCEILRFIRALKLVCDQNREEIGPLGVTEVYREMDEILGARMLNLRMFWKQLYEHQIIGNLPDRKTALRLEEDALAAFTEYLTREVETERYLVLSHTSVVVLRRIVGFSCGKDSVGSDEVEVTFAQVNAQSLPFFHEAVQELTRIGILRVVNDSFIIHPRTIQDHYVYQDILKGFDHATMNVD